MQQRLLKLRFAFYGSEKGEEAGHWAWQREPINRQKLAHAQKLVGVFGR
jgi:hypothetical protein